MVGPARDLEDLRGGISLLPDFEESAEERGTKPFIEVEVPDPDEFLTKPGLMLGAVLGYDTLARFAAEPHCGPDQWFADASGRAESRVSMAATNVCAAGPAPQAPMRA